jgi:hypothetical protein
MSKTDNPLAQFFRQPAIYIRLPSQGRTWPAGSVDIPANGEIPVYPMTAIDEITYRTPDALFNGEAVVSVITSCVPNIKNGWAVPITDLDAILVAIRIASYGHQMDIGTKCPSCQEEHDFALDLRTIIDKLKAADYSSGLTVGDLAVYFKPLSYREVTDNSQMQFEQQKTIQLLSAAEVTEKDKVTRLNEMMKKIVEITVRALAQSISEIRVGPTTVTDPIHIEEYLKNCERSVYDQIKDRALSLRADSELQPLHISCPSCQFKYDQEFTLDMARFFVSAS